MTPSFQENTNAYPSPDTQICMSRNVGATDRQLRTTLGAIFGIGSLAILAGVGSLPTGLSPVLGVIALIMLGTAATGTCGLYSVLGVSTCSAKAEN